MATPAPQGLRAVITCGISLGNGTNTSQPLPKPSYSSVTKTSVSKQSWKFGFKPFLNSSELLDWDHFMKPRFPQCSAFPDRSRADISVQSQTI